MNTLSATVAQFDKSVPNKNISISVYDKVHFKCFDTIVDWAGKKVSQLFCDHKSTVSKKQNFPFFSILD